MSQRPTILLPIRVLEGESIPEGVPQLLSGARVIVLGYYEVPDQTAPGQARVQFEDRATDRLETFIELFEQAGARAIDRLVFTHQVQATIDRFVHEEGCDAVLVPSAVGDLQRALIALRGTVGQERMVRVVTGLFGHRETTITLFHVDAENASVPDMSGLVDQLVEAGIDRTSIDIDVRRGDDPLEMLVDVSKAFDILVMGETDPSLRTYVFGMTAEQVADRFLGPVVIVQREPDDVRQADGSSSPQ